MQTLEQGHKPYICPVCGYPKLSEPPMNFSICSCCGTEFEYDDFTTPYSVLRNRWLTNGAKWFSPEELPPAGWKPMEQLADLQYLNSGPKDLIQEGNSHVIGSFVIRVHTMLSIQADGPLMNPGTSWRSF
jgi:hypothetical protein